MRARRPAAGPLSLLLLCAPVIALHTDVLGLAALPSLSPAALADIQANALSGLLPW